MSDFELRNGALVPPTNGHGNPAQEISPGRFRPLFLADLCDDLMASCNAAAEARRTGIIRGPMTGLRQVDKVLGGSLAPGIHLIQAAPGAGKTALKLQIATDCGFPVVYVTAEMPPIELMRRIVSRHTCTYLGKLKDGEVDGEAAGRLGTTVVAKVPYLVILDATCERVMPDDICGVADALRRQAQTDQVLIAVDSLQVWAKQIASGDQGEYDAINAGIRALCGISAELKCPILASSHRNRKGQQDGGLHAGKGSGDLEYMAETVLDMDAHERRSGDISWTVTLTVHKNRHGETGIDFPLKFEGRIQNFREA